MEINIHNAKSGKFVTKIENVSILKIEFSIIINFIKIIQVSTKFKYYVIFVKLMYFKKYFESAMLKILNIYI